MTEELNPECAACEQKVCHDGYNFCNEAMKENSFYKNDRLYKGIKPNKKLSYAELENKLKEQQKENKQIKKECLEVYKEWRQMDKEKQKLIKENKELQESLVEWQKTCEAKSDTNSQLIKQLADKNEQIDKMKCCGNCNHHRYTYGELECMTRGCKNKRKWELAND